MSLTEAEHWQLTLTRASGIFRRFYVRWFHSFPKHDAAPLEIAVSVARGSCTCSWQDWRQAIEITNGPAPLVPSTLCNTDHVLLPLYVSVSRQLQLPLSIHMIRGSLIYVCFYYYLQITMLLVTLLFVRDVNCEFHKYHLQSWSKTKENYVKS